MCGCAACWCTVSGTRCEVGAGTVSFIVLVVCFLCTWRCGVTQCGRESPAALARALLFPSSPGAVHVVSRGFPLPPPKIPECHHDDKAVCQSAPGRQNARLHPQTRAGAETIWPS